MTVRHTTSARRAALAAAALATTLLPAATFAAGDAAAIARGAYIATSSGCVDCHMPTVMGPKGPEKALNLGLSGHPESLVMGTPPAMSGNWVWVGAGTVTAFAGPWGVSYAANLTPDKDTGIGNWREEDFIAALRTGRHMGVGRPIMPPMPWELIGKMSDDDLKAIYAFLQSQPPVRNRVPDYQPPAVAAK